MKKIELSGVQFCLQLYHNKIGRPRSTSLISIITSMLTDRIGRQKVLLPVHHNKNKIKKQHKILLAFSLPARRENKQRNKSKTGSPIEVLLQRPRRMTITVLLRCHVHTLGESEEAGKAKNKTSRKGGSKVFPI